MRGIARRVWLIVLCASMVNLALGGVFAVRTVRFVAGAASASGTVVRLDVSESEHGTLYHPVFTYADAAGKSHTVVASWGSSPPGYKAGEKVIVLYDPGNPSDGRIKSLMSLWGLPLFFGISGLAALGMSVGVRVGLVRSTDVRTAQAQPDLPQPLEATAWKRYARYAAISTLIPCGICIVSNWNRGREAFPGAILLVFVFPLGDLLFLEFGSFCINRMARGPFPPNWFGRAMQELARNAQVPLRVFHLGFCLLFSATLWLIGALSAL